MYNDSSPTTVDQGVILDSVYFYSLDQHHKGLVLTPACDFAQHKAELVQICALLPANFLVSTLRETVWSKQNRNNVKGQIKNMIKQKFPRYHWLASLPGIIPTLVADFQNIASIPFIEIENTELKAELMSPYREQIPARYAAYMGRVGTPDFDHGDIDEWAESIVEELGL